MWRVDYWTGRVWRKFGRTFQRGHARQWAAQLMAGGLTTRVKYVPRVA